MHTYISCICIYAYMYIYAYYETGPGRGPSQGPGPGPVPGPGVVSNMHTLCMRMHAYDIHEAISIFRCKFR